MRYYKLCNLFFSLTAYFLQMGILHYLEETN